MGEEGQEFPQLARMNRVGKVKKIVDPSICGVPHSGNQGPRRRRYLVYAMRCRSAFPKPASGGINEKGIDEPQDSILLNLARWSGYMVCFGPDR